MATLARSTLSLGSRRDLGRFSFGARCETLCGREDSHYPVRAGKGWQGLARTGKDWQGLARTGKDWQGPARAGEGQTRLCPKVLQRRAFCATNNNNNHGDSLAVLLGNTSAQWMVLGAGVYMLARRSNDHQYRVIRKKRRTRR